MKTFFSALFVLFLNHFASAQEVELMVLGTLQDGGMPHIGCTQEACVKLIKAPDPTKKVVSLGLIDHQNQKNYLFEATPDISTQLSILNEYSGEKNNIIPSGIFTTHAHIGHYTGLMQLGKEALGAKQATLYAMPKMRAFLRENQPWKLLLDQENTILKPMESGVKIHLSNQLKVIPILVPHRDELSETVGFKILGPNKSVLFIPDINKWSIWEKNIVAEINKVDYAFVDATFYDGAEIGYRDLSEIPHPFVIESIELFKELNTDQKAKIYFIHLNHTNPLIDPHSIASKEVEALGFHIARFGMRFGL